MSTNYLAQLSVNLSTFNAVNINYNTLTGSTITGSTILNNTITTRQVNFSTLTGSTLTVGNIQGTSVSATTVTASTITTTGNITVSGPIFANNPVALWMPSNGSASIYITDSSSNPIGTTTYGRYFGVSGSIYQDFYNLFQWRTTSLGGTVSTTPMILTSAGNLNLSGLISCASMNTTGNVGIGTTAPQYQLQIMSGAVGFQGSSIPNTTLASFLGNIAYNSTGRYDIEVGSNNTGLGNLGNIYKWAMGVNYTPNGVGGTAPNIGGNFEITSIACNAISYTGTDTRTARLVVTTSGNVGIGTTSPTVPFDVLSNNAVSGQFKMTTDACRVVFDGSAGGDLIFKSAGVSKWGIYGNSTAMLFLTNDSYATTPPFTILNSNGYVGIGITNPSSLLHVNGTTTFGNGNGSSNYNTNAGTITAPDSGGQVSGSTSTNNYGTSLNIYGGRLTTGVWNNSNFGGDIVLAGGDMVDMNNNGTASGNYVGGNIFLRSGRVAVNNVAGNTQTVIPGSIYFQIGSGSRNTSSSLGGYNTAMTINSSGLNIPVDYAYSQFNNGPPVGQLNLLSAVLRLTLGAYYTSGVNEATAIQAWDIGGLGQPLYLNPNGGKVYINNSGAMIANESSISVGGGQLSTGTYNATFGMQTGRVGMTGQYNTLMGSSVAYELTTGSNNTCLGTNAGISLRTGSNNTYLGNGAGNGSGSAVTNEIVIGTNNLAGGGSNTVTIGGPANTINYFRGNILSSGVGGGAGNSINMNANAGELLLSHVLGNFGSNFGTFTYDGIVIGSISQSSTSSVSFNTTSDRRLKGDITQIPNHIDILKKLKPVTFKWNDDHIQDFGFIADEFQEVFPLYVQGQKDEVDSDGKPKYQSMSDKPCIPLLVTCVQDQQAQIEILTAQIAQLMQRLTAAGIA